ncbi:MAG: hypothetical protein AAF432_04040 [Planctomycetota bacterium]
MTKLVFRDARQRRSDALERRGNTLVLVAAILSLLVIIATAFITRSQGNRLTGSALLASEQLNDSRESIADAISYEIASALFVRPIPKTDPFASIGFSADANTPRRPIPSNATRYGMDVETINVGGFVTYEFPYNRASHEVRPWTNWPDTMPPGVPFAALINSILPKGPGHDPLGTAFPVQPLIDIQMFNGLSLYNPAGNPGTSDTRWLASTEPYRMTTSPVVNADSIAHDVKQSDTFYLWPHLTNLSRAGNSWRVITDISDIGDLDNDGLGRLVTNLNIPIEQFTPIRPAEFWGLAGNQQFSTGYSGTGLSGGTAPFLNRWANWMGVAPFPSADTPIGLAGYLQCYIPQFGAASNTGSSLNIPSNFVRLRDPQVQGLTYPTLGGNQSDEFVDGSFRHLQSRILADADGDGFTDSFWFTSPLAMPNGLMQIVAVRIVDNSAMVNVNAASRFDDDDTRGETPADIALLGSNLSVPFSFTHTRREANVGLFDNPDNRMANVNGGVAGDFRAGYRQSPEAWNRFQINAGFVRRDGVNYGNAILAPNSNDRLAWWRGNGRVPQARNYKFPNPDDTLDPNDTTKTYSLFPERWYTGFALNNEIELRAYHGNNIAWVWSALEAGVQRLENTGPTEGLIRGQLQLNESVEAGEFNKPARALLRDVRRKMTTFSGARNELLPPWLWPTLSINTDTSVNPGIQNVLDNVPDPTTIRSLLLGRRKFDLRGGANLTNALALRREINSGWTFDIRADFYREDLRDLIERALIQRPRNTALGYFTAFNDDLQGSLTEPTGAYLQENENTPPSMNDPFMIRNNELASGLAANILAYRNGDLRSNLFPYTNVTTDPRPLPDQYLLRDAIKIKAEPLTLQPNRMIGLEAQPFLLEAFIAHVHGSDQMPTPPPGAPGQLSPASDPILNSGSFTVADHEQSTVVCVQIANPFEVSVDLWDYVISVFGQNLRLADIVPNTDERYLPPATEWRPSTATFAVIDRQFDHDNPKFGGTIASFRSLWEDFLDVGTEQQHQIRNADGLGLTSFDPNNLGFGESSGYYLVDASTWSNERDAYDNPPNEDVHSIELSRIDRSLPILADGSAGGTEHLVVIDRFDDQPLIAFNDGAGEFSSEFESFGDAVQNLEYYLPPDDMGIEPGTVNWGDPNPELPGIRLGEGDTYVNYARVTRAWGFDFQPTVSPNTAVAGNIIQPFERNPRFVFGDQQVTWSNQDLLAGDAPPNGTDSEPYRGERFQILDDEVDSDLSYGLGTSVDNQGMHETAWFTREYENSQGDTIRRKPTFFDHQGVELGANPGEFDRAAFADKGFYGTSRQLNFPMQLLLKNDDFKQVGEILNVWMHGHMVSMDDNTYAETTRTFSEFLAEQIENYPDDPELKRRVGRLQIDTVELTNGEILSPVVGDLDTTFYDATRPADYLRQSAGFDPPMPAGARLLDAFVCDGRGIHVEDAYGNTQYEYWLAGGFRDEITPGLININTASMEVMRTLPHWSRMVHVWKGDFTYPFANTARAVDMYRHRLNGDANILQGALNSSLQQNPAQGYIGGPNYAAPDSVPDMTRRDWGFMSLGELMLMNEPGQQLPGVFQPTDPLIAADATAYMGSDFGDNRLQVHTKESWRIDFAGAGIDPTLQPMRTQQTGDLAFGSWISTDLNPALNTSAINGSGSNEAAFFQSANRTAPIFPGTGDDTAGDAEETGLLFAGASNLVTTRSDVFTVYFKVRTFKQNPITGEWNALDPEMLVDNSRYVMLVDRSNVDTPNDRPIIRYLEKLPD